MLSKILKTAALGLCLAVTGSFPAAAADFYRTYTSKAAMSAVKCSSLGTRDGFAQINDSGNIEYWTYDASATDAEDSTHIRCSGYTTSGVWAYLIGVGDFSGTINPGADPAVTLMDSENPGTDKQIAQFAADYSTGIDGQENGDAWLRVLVEGNYKSLVEWVDGVDIVQIGSPTGFTEIIEESEASTGGTTPTIDLEDGTFFTHTVATGTTTFTFSNPAASGTASSFTLVLTNGGSQTVNWPASVDWAGGSGGPSLTPSGVDILTFFTIDGGTTWYGFAAGLNMS